MAYPSAAMRVLWISERFPPDRGGAAVSAGRQVRALAPHCERLDILGLTDALRPGHADVVESDGHRRIRVGRSSDDSESLQILAATAENWIRSQRCQLVHGFFAVPAGHVATCVARVAGLPVCVSLRGNDVDRAMFHGPRFAWLSFVLTHADALVGVSKEILAKARALTGRSEGLHWIPNGVDADVFSPRAAGELPAALAGAPRPWFAFSGELRFKKGLVVLEALAERLAAEGRGTLVCIGGLRDDAAPEQAWARISAAARARIVSLPFEREAARLARIYAAMDLFVFPSLWDGVPNAILEAMAAARPVLATRVGGVPDVLEDGVDGFLVDPAALDAFPERALALACAEPARLARVGIAARERVARDFTIVAERDRHLAVWRGLLA